MEEVIKFLGGAAIMMAAVAWLVKELAKHFLNKDIEIHRTLLEQENEKKSINYKEKIDLYKEISQPIVELIVEIEHNQSIAMESLKAFERKRLMITAQLTMFAPDYVYHSYNRLIDYLYNSFEGKEEYSFEQFREIAMQFLSDIRKDIGIYKDDIVYAGNR